MSTIGRTRMNRKDLATATAIALAVLAAPALSIGLGMHAGTLLEGEPLVVSEWTVHRESGLEIWTFEDGSRCVAYRTGLSCDWN